MRFRTMLVSCLLVLLCALASAQRKYDFVMSPADSDLNANVSLQAFTSGTLIGNYDPNTNPAGTRTKPGLFGNFGATENVPVPVEVNPLVEGNVASKPAGTFSMVLHPEAGQVVLLDFFSDLLHSGAVSLPASAEFATDGFRTRNPTSTYPAGRFTVPVGEILVTQLTATQVGEPAVGTLTPLGGNRYAFAVAPTVVLFIHAEMQGYVLETTSNPNPLALVGEVEIQGDTATILSVNTIDWSDVDTPNQPIPQFAMDLPTVFPPGDVAHLLFDLTLNEVRTHVSGTYTIAASGAASYRTVSGMVTLGDYTAPTGGMNIPIEVRTPGETTPLETHVVALNDAGEYQFQTALWGTFDLSAKGLHWLRRTVMGVALDKDVQVDFTLTNGDIDGDNEVTLFDFGALVAAFGSMPGDAHWNSEADLDGDEEVTLFDFGILVRNFGAIGDE
ncbi:MAG: hypothetical protein KatS3mg022_3544 [Armatimonadota bacterium]|nr:MAG: hypothetical protein KatS3mg022_3544 [Armatimonadota bacterium]